MQPLISNYLQLTNSLAAPPIPEVLAALSSNAKSVSISHSTGELPDSSVVALCGVIPVSCWEDITFNDLSLNTGTWLVIADAASKSKALTKLTIKNCKFRDDLSPAEFARALGTCQLQCLEISDCLLGDAFMGVLADTSLIQCDRLHSLKMIGCGVSDEGANRLAKALEAVGMMSGLKCLDLSFNRIGDRGALALSSMLAGTQLQSTVQLQELELEANQITDVGCLALAQASKEACFLCRLNLSMNHITDVTVQALTDVLRITSSSLKQVAIAGVRANEGSAIELLKAVIRNNTLQFLDMRGIPLGAEGVTQLCQLIRYTATLNTLAVDVATKEGAETIAKDLKANRSLMHMTLGGPVLDHVRLQISEILAANTHRITTGSPARKQGHIHAWIENATLGNPVSGHSALAQAQSNRSDRRNSKSRPSSPGPGILRSPRSETGGSQYSHGTYTTSKTHKTSATYLSFQFSQMSRKTGISSNPLRLSTSMAAGGAAEKAAVIFRRHDLNQDNFLNRDEMLAALHEVGVFNGIKARHIGKYLDHEFKKADWDNDGRISLQDFITYYEKIAFFQTQIARESRIKSASHRLGVPEGVENNPSLKRVFKNYCKYALGQGRVYNQEVTLMNAQQFHRLLQDAGFVEPEGRLSTTAVDVIFHRYRPSTSRKLGYKEFLEALASVAYESGMQFDDLLVCLGCKGTPLSPEASMRESDAASQAGLVLRSSAQDGSMAMDTPFAGNTMPGPHGLASIQELPTPMATPQHTTGGNAPVNINIMKPHFTQSPVLNPVKEKTGKKVAKKSSNAKGGNAMQALNTNNPLFESQVLLTSNPDKTSAADKKYRQELEARIIMLEQRLAQQANAQNQVSVGSGVTGIIGGGPDAGVTASSIAARLSKLEASLSSTVVKQEEIEGMSRNMETMQSLMGRLADEMARLKPAMNNSAGNASQAGDSKQQTELSKQVEALTSLVGSLAGDVRGMLNRVDGLSGQLATVSLEQKSLNMRVSGSVGGSAATTAATGASISPEALTAMEKRLAERQARFEGALMQVARQVDMLDGKLKDTQHVAPQDAPLIQAKIPAGKLIA